MRIETVKAQALYPSRPTCEPYREAIQKYFGNLTPIALFIADKESIGCTVNISRKANSNGTYDYCIFQINNEPSVQNDLDKCIKRARQKYDDRGDWSAWYAVCDVNRTPKYQGIKCK